MSELCTVCGKCGGKTERGFIKDSNQSWVMTSQWVKGKPEMSFFGNIKTEGKRHFEVVVYRCESCGFLEQYAPL